MNIYDVVVEDIYDKSNTKKFSVSQPNAKLAHKHGLKYCNALREEISKITLKGKVLFSLKAGFLDNE